MMSVPTYDRFIEPILRFLAGRPGGSPARDAHEAAAQALGLTDADRQELLPSGTQPVYKNRCGWAHDRLKRAGLSSNPGRGFWQLTAKGLEFAKAHPAPLSAEEVAQLAQDYLDVRLRERPNGAVTIIPALTSGAANQGAPPKSPDDRLSEALQELHASVAVELNEALQNASPSFFETVVLDLLHAMGYGASRQDLRRVGGTGDGGIDGVISLDKLGLENVYVQAKRWQQTVGRPEIQAFYGALAGQHAKKGVFITTSSYSSQAMEFVRSVEGVVLIDGARLTELMIEHGVGVTERIIKIAKVDIEYFVEETA